MGLDRGLEKGATWPNFMRNDAKKMAKEIIRVDSDFALWAVWAKLLDKVSAGFESIFGQKNCYV